MSTTTFSQLPGTLNVDIVQGDDVAFTIDFDVNMTGYLVASEIRSTISHAVVATPTTTLSAPATGIVVVTMTDTQTSSLPVGTYRWALSWETPAGDNRMVLSGIWEVRK